MAFTRQVDFPQRRIYRGSLPSGVYLRRFLGFNFSKWLCFCYNSLKMYTKFWLWPWLPSSNSTIIQIFEESKRIMWELVRSQCYLAASSLCLYFVNETIIVYHRLLSPCIPNVAKVLLLYAALPNGLKRHFERATYQKSNINSVSKERRRWEGHLGSG